MPQRSENAGVLEALELRSKADSWWISIPKGVILGLVAVTTPIYLGAIVL